MSDMKCPICGSELKHETTTGIYCCKRIFVDCPLGLGTGAFGTKELWQTLTDSMKEHDLCHDALVERTKELDRTRKALKIAIHRLNQIAEHDCDQGCMYVAQNALEQITALEQKDVK